MAESCSRKLIVEICNAKNLMPKDGQGTTSSYVIVDYDGQRRRTKTILRDLNPQWNEKLEFLMEESYSIAPEILELNVYNDKKTGRGSNFLGKVKISANNFVKAGEDPPPLVYYPLEKRSVFSQIRGEIGLKVWYTNEKSQQSQTPAPAAQKTESNEKKNLENVEAKKKETEEKKSEENTQAKSPQPPSQQKKQRSEDSNNPPLSQQKNTEKSKTLPSSKKLELESRFFQKISTGTSYDLVDQMPFLFARVVKAKISKPETESSSYSAKLSIGTHIIKTKSQAVNGEWDQVFAFHKESLNSTSLEISVWSQKNVAGKDDKVDEISCGAVSFDLQEVPKRVPPDSALAPQWYSLEGDGSPGNDVMLSVWIGTQADEAFQEAWQSDSGGLIPETRSKVYLSPKLWYLRLTIIQTQDLQLPISEPKARNPELYVKAQLGAQIFKTSRTGASIGSSNPTWHEDLIFVAAEPFDPFLTISVEDSMSSITVGQTKVQMATVDKRTDDKTEPQSKWLNLTKQEDKNSSYAGRIHVSLCLEGGYHVLDEASHVISDVRATAKHLAAPPIGLLEIGIRGANNLIPVTGGKTDAYVVAKYGPKWIRTRTILDRFSPRWNEQYTWEVYDPCTMLTIGVFNNGRFNHGGGADTRLGKLRVRISTLDTNRVYIGTYSLTVLLPTGAKKMGEIEIALRFSCSSWASLIQTYGNPILPRMHYIKPLGQVRQEILRHNAMKIVAMRLGRSEPALGQEVVQFMLDSDLNQWSLRRSKANWLRVMGCLSRAAIFMAWLNRIRTWSHPPSTFLAHIIILVTLLLPHLTLPMFLIYILFVVMLRFRRFRSKPVSIEMDTRLSCIDGVGLDELDEEFDGFPSVRSADQIRARYDRLRALAGRTQTLLGDMAGQWERLEALFNWKDPRATSIFILVCLLTSLIFYLVPFKIIGLVFGFYYFRHPRFRDDMPSKFMNFFRRLPPQSDRIL